MVVSVIINSLEEGVRCMLIKFTDIDSGWAAGESANSTDVQNQLEKSAYCLSSVGSYISRKI